MIPVRADLDEEYVLTGMLDRGVTEWNAKWLKVVQRSKAS